MLTSTTRKLTRAAIVAGLFLAAAGTLMTASSEPAAAICKRGGPHCTPVTTQSLPTVGGKQIPGSGWQDPDCQYYGNCGSSEVKGTAARRK